SRRKWPNYPWSTLMHDKSLIDKLSEHEGPLPYSTADWVLPADDDDVEKSGPLSASFGSKRRRQNELVSRLKGRRKYAPPVKGGTKKKRKRLAQNLLRRRLTR